MLNPLRRVSELLAQAMRGKHDVELKEFLARAAKWKPAGFDEEMNVRLAYYLGDQEQDLVAHLRIAFPLSYGQMVPHTVRIMRKVVDARSKLFGKDSRFTIRRAQETTGEIGDPYPADSAEARRWAELQKVADFKRRLRTVNRWTEALNTVVVAVGYDERAQAATLTIFPPQFVHVDFDPDHPTDLDKAKGILLEVAGPAGVASSSRKLEEKRFEYWSAAEARPEHYVIDGSGELVTVASMNGENPYRAADGKPVVPLVAFHSEELELGFFTAANGDLVRSNRSINVTLTDEHHIARLQGFGQTYISRTTSAGGEAAPKAELHFGPDKAVYLNRGEEAGVLSTNPQLDALEAIVTADARRVTTLWDVPAGTVLADSRTVASAEALVVEREPQLEAREDQVERYRAPVERLFELLRIVVNHHAPTLKQLPKAARITWEPGDLRIPFSPQVEQDIDFADLEKDLTTLPAILAKRRGITEDEAEKLLERHRETNERTKPKAPAVPGAPGGEDDQLDPGEKPPVEPPEPPEPPKPAGEE